MPNHVYTSMTITGLPADIKAFAEKHFAENSGFDLESFVPMPEELRGTRAPSDKPNPELIKKYGFDNWYDWCIQNWGTKWNTYDGDTDVMEDTIHTNFCTAWGLPEPVFKVLGEMYPTLEVNITCVEEGRFFSGTMSIKDGVVDASGITDDDKQWKYFAEELMGWYDEDDEDEEGYVH